MKNAFATMLLLCFCLYVHAQIPVSPEFPNPMPFIHPLQQQPPQGLQYIRTQSDQDGKKYYCYTYAAPGHEPSLEVWTSWSQKTAMPAGKKEQYSYPGYSNTGKLISKKEYKGFDNNTSYEYNKEGLLVKEISKQKTITYTYKRSKEGHIVEAVQLTELPALPPFRKEKEILKHYYRYVYATQFPDTLLMAIVYKTEQRNKETPKNYKTSYTYNADKTISSWWYGSDAGRMLSTGTVFYDAKGNIASIDKKSSVFSSQNRNVFYTWQQNRLTSKVDAYNRSYYEYDEEGKLTHQLDERFNKVLKQWRKEYELHIQWQPTRMQDGFSIDEGKAGNGTIYIFKTPQ